MPVQYKPTIPSEPKPHDSWDVRRWDETRRRRRILTGTWEEDLKKWRRDLLGSTRASVMGPVDLSRNFFRSLTDQMSVLYLERPDIYHPSGTYPELLGQDVELELPNGVSETVRDEGLVEASGLWSLMKQVMQYAIGLNEMFMQPMVVPSKYEGDEARIVYRPVTPDHIVAEADPKDPGVPWLLRELVLRDHPGSERKLIWTWDEWDLRNLENPQYRIIDATQGKGETDLTEAYLDGSKSGDDYPVEWRRNSGVPVMPWVVYHRRQSQNIFAGPCEGREAVDGTLRLAVHWNFWGHCLQEASWPQRWSLGATPRPTVIVDDSEDGGPIHHTVVDPTTIVEFDVDDNAPNPQIGQFQSGSDPKTLGEALASDEARLADQYGVDASDLVRTGGDPRSGYALKISQDKKREMQEQFRPQFERADKQLLGLTAIVVNGTLGTDYPETGYHIKYAPIGGYGDEDTPDTPDE